ncbi:MAG: hypothetical protein A3E87_05505 [Gammaproteobacteria bacterium RIFCSPHIGHO2_12_FULL_35_23]|nr:MAG: hypothetical protein A3E87_05505 [Gammaproteobacteria bacterium RIFCSPHIGHO2_12_FULL_35_23]
MLTLTPPSLEAVFQQIPGILWWKKDINSTYLEANMECAKLFGFNNPESIQNITDFQLNCKFSELAEIFQQCDKRVIEYKKPIKLLEILQCNQNNWKIMLVTKAPIFNVQNNTIGTAGLCIDVTTSFTKVGCYLSDSQLNTKKEKLLQSSYVIGKSNFFDIRLTPRQSECLFFILRGKTIKGIAKILNLSARTVECYIEQLKLKFNCHTKSQLISTAIEQGYLNNIPEIFFTKQTSIILQ